MFGVKRECSWTDSWGDINEVLDLYANNFGVNVVVYNSEGNKSASNWRKGQLNIYFYSTIDKAKSIKLERFDEVFGLSLRDDQRDALSPSRLGLPIKDPSGKIVAEYINRSLFVLFDLPYTRRNAKELMTLILEQFVIQCLMPKAFVVNREKLESQLNMFMANEYPNLLERQILNNINGIREKLSRLKDDNNNMIRSIIQNNQEAMVINASIKEFEKQPFSLTDEFENIKKIPMVQRVVTVKLHGEFVINVFTDLIVINYKGDSYQIGKFKIEIHLDGLEGGVRCYNIAGFKFDDEFDHPHVIDGECCLGNIEEIIPKLIGSYKLADTVKYMMSFLRSYNDSNPYIDIRKWPVIKRKVT